MSMVSSPLGTQAPSRRAPRALGTSQTGLARWTVRSKLRASPPQRYARCAGAARRIACTPRIERPPTVLVVACQLVPLQALGSASGILGPNVRQHAGHAARGRQGQERMVAIVL